MSIFTLSHTLVLASSSKVRDRMMRSVGLPVTVIRPRAEEEELKSSFVEGMPPRDQAQALARAKSASVNALHPGWAVIGADQICELDGHIFSKPGDVATAIQQLKTLRGKTHLQHSAVALYHHGECVWETVETARLTMRNLTDEECAAYVALDKPLSACGAYHYEANGKHLFARVEGRDDVILGMPLQPLLNALYERGLLRISPLALAS